MNTKNMEEAFEKFKQQGQNSVDNLLQWMKDSKVIENTREAEEKARRLFDDAANKQSVELAKFKQALGKLADQQKKSMDELANSLAAESERMLNKLKAAIEAGAKAFVEAVNK